MVYPIHLQKYGDFGPAARGLLQCRNPAGFQHLCRAVIQSGVVADWMAQARLCLEFRGNVNKVRSAGVPSILDFQEIAEEGLLEDLANRSKLDITLLEAVYCANKDEKLISRLRAA